MKRSGGDPFGPPLLSLSRTSRQEICHVIAARSNRCRAWVKRAAVRELKRGQTSKNIRTNLRTSAKTIDMLLLIIYNRQVESRYGSRRSGNVSERFATKFILLFDDHERDICFHAHYFFRRTRLSLNNRKSKSITRSAIVRYVLSARTANSSV